MNVETQCHLSRLREHKAQRRRDRDAAQQNRCREMIRGVLEQLPAAGLRDSHSPASS